ncbi:hypothetical protein MNBD_CHLOROFLEXI01-989, partial [hydrothermal vent metagenome]
PTKKQTLCQCFFRRVGAFYAPRIRCTVTIQNRKHDRFLETCHVWNFVVDGQQGGFLGFACGGGGEDEGECAKNVAKFVAGETVEVGDEAV